MGSLRRRNRLERGPNAARVGPTQCSACGIALHPTFGKDGASDLPTSPKPHHTLCCEGLRKGRNLPEARRSPARRGRPRSKAGRRGQRRRRPVARRRRAYPDLSARLREGGGGNSLPRRREASRDRLEGQAVELRRRREPVPASGGGAPDPPRVPFRSRAGGPHVAGGSVASPDHCGLRGDAAATASALSAGG